VILLSDSSDAKLKSVVW